LAYYQTEVDSYFWSIHKTCRSQAVEILLLYLSSYIRIDTYNFFHIHFLVINQTINQ